ncbi:hypothetical protein UFOVP164_33 [uncultured Caudovirales phage]|uniref:Uncharacterized protein n=1 Tax=uncultured Caudovirales phage TaxID=2100421 RepID=A0A6J7XQ31_9CAUD|nr:hypothetical protein UFOVP164_33 [uncultured Caudovirales phage]
MNREEIIRMATEAYKTCDHIPNLKIPKEFIEHFAALVAFAEREACAKMCDYLWEDDYSAYACAEAIRAKGQA